MTKLNLGCGQNKIDGAINVDKYGSCAPDVIWDLETFPWPFEDNAAHEIILHHALEHMGGEVSVFLNIMKELYRVSAPNAKIFIAVPHPRSDGFAGDPTHVRPINPEILALFSKKKNRKWKEIGCSHTPLATYIDVDFDIADVKFTLMPHWATQMDSGAMTREQFDFAMASYYNVISEIKITLTACK